MGGRPQARRLEESSHSRLRFLVRVLAAPRPERDTSKPETLDSRILPHSNRGEWKDGRKAEIRAVHHIREYSLQLAT